MSIIDQLKTLARGMHPETGQALPEDSMAHRPDVIRMLFELAEDLSCALPDDIHGTALKGRKETLDEKRQRNIAAGLPTNSGLPWTDEDHQYLCEQYQLGVPMPRLAVQLQRKESALVARLLRAGLMSDQQAEVFRVVHRAVGPATGRKGKS